MLEYDKNGLVQLDKLDTVEEHRVLIPSDLQKLIILISGSMPGTGASTLEKILATTLNLESVSAGLVRRTIALDYVTHCHELYKELHGADVEFTEKNEPLLNEFFELAWRKFTHKYFTDKHRLRKLKRINQRLNHVTEAGNGILHAQENLTVFTRHQVKFGLLSSNPVIRDMSQRFDTIPDILAYSSLTDKPKKRKLGHTLEGKLALLIQPIALRNMNPKDRSKAPSLEDDDTTAVVPIFLNVSERESARRVLQREVITGALTPPEGFTKEHVLAYFNQNELPSDRTARRKLLQWLDVETQRLQEVNSNRMLQDYDRWSELYGMPINTETLQERATATIDTTSKNRAEVVLAAYEAVIKEVPHINTLLLLDVLSQQFDEAETLVDQT